MRIIVDAMGGDRAPDEIVRGALLAAEQLHTEITLVGRGSLLLNVLRDQGVATLPPGIEIADAPDAVEMNDDPTRVLHTRKQSSMVVGLKLLADGAGDAFVSAGNTGALITASTLLVRRIPGIRRAALGPMLPTAKGKAMVLDAGANAECLPEFLLQFAFLGTIYCRALYGIQNPTVGLLNIGTETGKGTAMQREAFKLLDEAGKAGHLNFIGNIEARTVPEGAADIIVCDGFSGNVLLKAVEGTAMLMTDKIRGIFTHNLLTKVGAIFCRPGLRALKREMDYREYGGSLMLGIRKPVVKAHGSSDAKAIYNAIRVASEMAAADIIEQIEKSMQYMTPGKGEKTC